MDLRSRRSFEALKPAVMAELTSAVARRAINGSISLMRNIWSRTVLAKMALRYLQTLLVESESGDVAPS